MIQFFVFQPKKSKAVGLGSNFFLSEKQRTYIFGTIRSEEFSCLCIVKSTGQDRLGRMTVCIGTNKKYITSEPLASFLILVCGITSAYENKYHFT